MILYHYTALSRVAPILVEGITRGDVPLSSTTGIEAPWLTDDRSPEGHGLSTGAAIFVDDAVRRTLKGALGAPGFRVDCDLDRTTFLHTEDKRAVRMTVRIPAGERRLVRWHIWARKRLTRNWYLRLDTGKSKRWWLFLGPIPPEWIVRIENLRTGEEIPVPGESKSAA